MFVPSHFPSDPGDGEHWDSVLRWGGEMLGIYIFLHVEGCVQMAGRWVCSNGGQGSWQGAVSAWMLAWVCAGVHRVIGGAWVAG